MGGSSGGSYILIFLAPEEYQPASSSWGEVPWAYDLDGDLAQEQRPCEDDDVEEGSGPGRASQINRFSQPTWSPGR